MSCHGSYAWIDAVGMVRGVLGEWSDPERVAEYLACEIPYRDVAEGVLLEALPEQVERVHDLVNVAVAHPLGLARDSLLGEHKALGDGAAAGVVDCRADLDPVESPRPERVIDECPDGTSHSAATLRRFGQPVADAGRTVPPGDIVEPNHPDDPPILDDHCFESRCCPQAASVCAG
jgi:hypothetical protein